MFLTLLLFGFLIDACGVYCSTDTEANFFIGFMFTILLDILIIVDVCIDSRQRLNLIIEKAPRKDLFTIRSECEYEDFEEAVRYFVMSSKYSIDMYGIESGMGGMQHTALFKSEEPFDQIRFDFNVFKSVYDN